MMDIYEEKQIQELPLSVPLFRKKVESFLKTNGLRLEKVNLYMAIQDADENILAGGGLDGDTIKCIAVSEKARSGGLAVPLISRLISVAAQQGHTNVKVFTKPENTAIFESLGFTVIGRAPKAVLMENGRGLAAYLSGFPVKPGMTDGHARPDRASRGVIIMNANPFTIGVAQTLAGLPMFSGIWLRLVAFVCIYLLLLLFIRFHARRLPETASFAKAEAHVPDRRMDRGLLLFAAILGAGIALVLCSGFIPALRDYTMIAVAVMFLVAGVAATLAAGMGLRGLLRSFLSGLIAIAPSVLMILMAASIRYTLVEGRILDSLLHMAVTAAGGMSRAALVLFIYGICLVLNFFIPSGSAKAFLLIPLIVPLAGLFGVSSQLCILAFAFGDGFSNVFYPTNPCLLISLGLVDTGYGKWAGYSIKFQLMNLLLTTGLLLFGLAVGY